jgi:hypothetical protein
MTGTPPPEHAGWFRDVRAILRAAEAVTPGLPALPLPRIAGTMAAFHYTDIPHAEDAREMVATAETILSYALKVEFAPRDVPPNGSTAYYVLSAYLPSGLRVDIVARAGIFDGTEAREMATVAA